MAFVNIPPPPPPPPQPQHLYPLTDLGTATMVSDLYGDKLRYSQTEECWYIYSGGRWCRENLKGSQRMITEACMMQRIAHPQHQGDLTSASYCKKVEYHARALLAISSDEWDKVTGVLNFRNCVLDLRTGEHLDHSPGLFLRQQIPYDYNPKADYSEWRKHLQVMTKGDQELQDLLQLLVGATLWGGSDRDQLFIHLRGKGRNGKGVFIRTLGKALGGYYVAAPINLFSLSEGAHSTEYMALKGSRMVGCSEMGTSKLNIGALKLMTGGDDITARAMRSNPVTFANTWLIWMATNYSLNTTGDSADALWERYLPILLGEAIPEAERDNTIEERLYGEVISSGIIRWAIDGCLMWREMGSKIPIPQSVRAWRNEERESSDVFGTFMIEMIEITGNQTQKITLQDIALSYETWRIANNETLKMSSKLIAADLRSRYGLEVKSGSGNRRTAFGLRFLRSGGTGI